MTDNCNGAEDTQAVDLVGPARFRVELTEEQLERVRAGEHPMEVFDCRPQEWEPTGAPDDWSVSTSTRE